MPPSSAQPHGGSPYAPAHHYGTPTPAAGPAFVVSREDVLSKRAALLAEAVDFQQFLDRIEGRLRMRPMGGDPVSRDVAQGINYRLREADDSYFNVCQAWVNNLRQTAETMTEVARQYGYTDDEIAASLSGGALGA
ncbi:MAG: hypothetical protein ACRDTF_08365 [Pseudonocardiaceae bacterium]